MHQHIVNPHKKDENVNGEDPQHEDQNGMGIVVEVEMRRRFLYISANPLSEMKYYVK